MFLSHRTIQSVAIVVISISLSFAFNSYIPRISVVTDDSLSSFSDFSSFKFTEYKRDKVILKSWLSDTFKSLGLDFDLEKLNFNARLTQFEDDKKPKSKAGTVIRTAVKGYSPTDSVPSSRSYTTRKESQIEIVVGPEGVKGDYNHYRTTALSSTPDRAVSILTTDVLKMLKSNGWPLVNEGDLGENIYVDNIDYTFFEVGKRYIFKARNGSTGGAAVTEEEGVVVEITERIEPCGNLCKLGFINDESIPPAERFEGCKKFLLWLDAKEGLRGWYGKIIGDGGAVKIGDQVTALEAAVA